MRESIENYNIARTHYTDSRDAGSSQGDDVGEDSSGLGEPELEPFPQADESSVSSTDPVVPQLPLTASLRSESSSSFNSLSPLNSPSSSSSSALSSPSRSRSASFRSNSARKVLEPLDPSLESPHRTPSGTDLRSSGSTSKQEELLELKIDASKKRSTAPPLAQPALGTGSSEQIGYTKFKTPQKQKQPKG